MYDFLITTSAVLMLIGFVITIWWIISKFRRQHKVVLGMPLGRVVLLCWIISIAFSASSTFTAEGKRISAQEDQSESVSESKVSSERKASSEIKVSSEKRASESKQHSQSISESKSKQSKAISTSNKHKVSSSTNKTDTNSGKPKSSTQTSKVKVGGLSYTKVNLVDFTDDPDKYDGKNIQTSGHILMIQRNPDDKNMYYVVIVPTDSHTSSGYADGHGTVAQIDIDTIQESNLSQGQNITVNGGGLEGQVTFNGKTVSTSIIVDSVTVN